MLIKIELQYPQEIPEEHWDQNVSQLWIQMTYSQFPQ